MRKYLLILMFFIYAFAVNAQVESSVCIGSIRNYKVQGSAGSVYNWHINGGLIISNPIKDSIIVKWGNLGGIYQIFVIETSIYGCPGDTIFSTVMVNPLLSIKITGPDEICAGESITLTAINSSSYYWSTGSGNQSITLQPLSSIQYSMIGSTVCGLDTVYKQITVHQKPQPDFSYSPELPMAGANIHFRYTGSPATSYSWYNDFNLLFSNQSNPVYSLQAGANPQIILYVTSPFGCTDSISKVIIFGGSTDIWVPNSFTPNRDGLNDVFKGESATEVKDFNLYIYNRWGQLIYESRNINIGWDGMYQGNEAAQGVYTFVMTYQTGTNQHSLSRKTGQITLYR
ncbi:MAG: gliding motility-associated C-terminal domain-containing protein [Bacteroidales bacterium]